MALTFANQQTLLSTLIGDDSTDTSSMFPLARRKKELNRGEVKFARDTKGLLEYETGAVASKEITVPADWFETFALTIDDKNITNEREISVKDWARYADWGGEEPLYYYWEFSGTRKLKLLASTGVNGKTYQLFYFQIPTTELDSDSDESLHPDEFREAPVYYAAYTLLQQIGKTELSTRYNQIYQNYVRDRQMDMAKKYLNLEKAVPDNNVVAPSIVDRQGQGYW